MRYYRKNEHEFLVNGLSHLRVMHMQSFTRKASPGRVIKIFNVVGTVLESPMNRVEPGTLLCLSFPETKCNAKEYTWGQNGPEETQVKMNVQLHKTKGALLHDEAEPVNAPPIQIKD